MKVHHVVRRSEPLRPRVMRRLPVRERRSVGAGIRRRGIELRNQFFGVLTLCDYGEDNMVRSDKVASCALAHGVRDPLHA